MLSRFRVLLLAGVALAVLLGIVSYVRPSVSLDEGVSFEYRKQEVWESSATLMLTQPRRSDRPAVAPVPDLRFANLSPVYARLASGDGVKKLIERNGAKLPGRFFAIAVVDSTPLPLITAVGQGPTAAAAKQTVTRGSRGFASYVEGLQRALPKAERVELAVLSNASPATLIDARKKTLPIFIFLAVVSAFVALAFILDNASRAPSPDRARGARIAGLAPPADAGDNRVGTERVAGAPVPAMSATHSPESEVEELELHKAGRWAKRSAR